MADLINPNDPDVLQYMLDMGGLAEEQREVDRQRAMAQGLRSRSATPEGRQAGKLYVAANPLEHIGAALGQGVANWKDRGSDATAKDIGERRQGFMKKLAGTLGKGGALGAAGRIGATPGTLDPRYGDEEDIGLGY